MATVLVWSITVILCSPYMCKNRQFTSFTLLFRLSFCGTVRNVVTMFLSVFSESVRSMIDLDICLIVLPLLSSFVPTCNIMWFGLNS